MITIGLVGRTNVGKSTLFNRLLGTYRAIVTDISGTTRELLREKTEVAGKHVELVDSPGLADFEEEMQFIDQIISESDILLFVVDGKEEMTQYDDRIRELILKSGKKQKTILLVNKLDKKVYRQDIDNFLAEWYGLGFSETIALSAQQNEGMEDLIDELLRRIGKIPQQEEQEELDENLLPLAIIGRPNTGKSTLMNTFAGEYVAHVQDKPGTTLDYIVYDIQWKGRTIKLYDTAGIRKKGKTVGLERIAYEKTLAMLKYAKPLVVLLIDLTEGMTHRDKTLYAEITNLGLPHVVAFNKIDEFSPQDAERLISQITTRVPVLRAAPRVKISGKEAIAVGSLLDAASRVWSEWLKRIPTPALNKAVTKARVTKPPRFPKNKICKWKYISQVDVAPPTFLVSVNNQEYANFSFKKRLKNVIRAEYGFQGIPIKLKLTSKVDSNPYLSN